MFKYLVSVSLLAITVVYLISSSVASIIESPAAVYFYPSTEYVHTVVEPYQGDYTNCTRVGSMCVPYAQPAPIAKGEPHE